MLTSYRPQAGDRVSVAGRRLVGHVRAIRHAATGLEAEVFEDGSRSGQWVPAADLRCLKMADPLPIPCEFLGWPQCSACGRVHVAHPSTLTVCDRCGARFEATA